MANTSSAKKAARQATKRRAHNMTQRTALRSAVKNVRKAIAAGDKNAAVATLEKSRGVIDRMASKGIVHRNAAARYKSRLAHAIKGMA